MDDLERDLNREIKWTDGEWEAVLEAINREESEDTHEKGINGTSSEKNG